MRLRIFTFILSSLTGLFGFTYLLSLDISDAAYYVIALGFSSLASTIILSVASIRKEKFISRIIFKDVVQISISKILAILNITLALIAFLIGINSEFFILYLVQSISIYPLISSFQKSTYYQFKKINTFWHIQFYGSILRACLVFFFIILEIFNAVFYSLVHLIITFQIYWLYHRSLAKLLIRKRRLKSWPIYFKPARLVDGFLRNSRVFVETGLSSILLSCIVILGISDKQSLNSLYAVIPFMNVAIVALRQTFYNYEVERKYVSFPPWQVLIFAFIGFIILNQAYAWDAFFMALPDLFKNIDNLFYFWSLQLIFFSFSIGITQVEVFRPQELFLFWSIFLFSLFTSFAAVIILEKLEWTLFIVPFSLSLSAIFSKSSMLIRRSITYSSKS